MTSASGVSWTAMGETQDSTRRMSVINTEPELIPI